MRYPHFLEKVAREGYFRLLAINTISGTESPKWRICEGKGEVAIVVVLPGHFQLVTLL